MGLEVLAATLFALAGCAAPMQEGGVEVLPGAGARMLMAMRYGMAPVGEAVEPAEARRAVYAEQLPPGAHKTGRLGDYVLDNGIVAVVVANVDGSKRSGKIVDFARWGGDGDDLDALDTTVLGVPVRYETVKTGYDPELAAAYVSVTGVVEVRPLDGSAAATSGARASVETRYDLAPALDAVLVTTRIKMLAVATPSSEEAPPATALLEDRVVLRGARATLSDARGPFVAPLGDAAGYALQPAGDGELRGDAIVVPDTKTPGLDGTFLYSRTLTALERPDSLAAEVAYARTLGEPIGELEVRVGDAASPSAAADLELDGRGADGGGGADGRALAARAIPACGTPRGYRVRVPAGRYAIAWKGAALASMGATSADVAGDRVTFLDVALGPSSEPFDAPARERRCPASDAVAELAP